MNNIFKMILFTADIEITAFDFINNSSLFYVLSLQHKLDELHFFFFYL